MALRIASATVYLHQYISVLHFDLVGLEVLRRRERLHLSCTDVEDRAVERTLDLEAFTEPFGQMGVFVRADVLDGEDVVADANEGDRLSAGFDLQRLTGRDVVHLRDLHEAIFGTRTLGQLTPPSS